MSVEAPTSALQSTTSESAEIFLRQQRLQSGTIDFNTKNSSLAPEDGVDTANGSLVRLLNLRRRLGKLPAEDRILPPVEAQRPIDFTAIDSEKLMTDVQRIRWFYYSTLGLKDEINVVRNFDPALERAMHEQLQTEEEKIAHKAHVRGNIIKALGERLNVVDSIVMYTIDSAGVLRSKSFGNEPFVEVVRRGAEHAKNLGTPDAQREQAQLRGIINMNNFMYDPRRVKKDRLFCISPQGFIDGTNKLRPGTTFTHNFVDAFELVDEDPETKTRYIQMTRYTSNATYKQYKSNLKGYRSNYYDNEKGPMENYYAENGIQIPCNEDSRGSEQIFAQLAGAVKGVTSRETCARIIEANSELIDSLAESICDSVFRPEKVAENNDALLAQTDIFKKAEAGVSVKPIKAILDSFKEKFSNLGERIIWLASQTIDRIIGACGSSGAFLRSINGILKKGLSMALNSFSQTAKALGIMGKDSMDALFFECDCGVVNDRPREGYRFNCKGCGEFTYCGPTNKANE